MDWSVANQQWSATSDDHQQHFSYITWSTPLSPLPIVQSTSVSAHFSFSASWITSSIHCPCSLWKWCFHSQSNPKYQVSVPKDDVLFISDPSIICGSLNALLKEYWQLLLYSSRPLFVAFLALGVYFWALFEAVMLSYCRTTNTLFVSQQGVALFSLYLVLCPIAPFVWHTARWSAWEISRCLFARAHPQYCRAIYRHWVLSRIVLFFSFLFSWRDIHFAWDDWREVQTEPHSCKFILFFSSIRCLACATECDNVLSLSLLSHRRPASLVRLCLTTSALLFLPIEWIISWLPCWMSSSHYECTPLLTRYCQLINQQICCSDD